MIVMAFWLDGFFFLVPKLHLFIFWGHGVITASLQAKKLFQTFSVFESSMNYRLLNEKCCDVVKS